MKAYNQVKLLGLQKDVNLLMTIAKSTTLDTHAERVLFLGLDEVIDNTILAMYKQIQIMYDNGLMNAYKFEEWNAIVEDLQQK
mgnify:CR=1 FL=1